MTETLEDYVNQFGKGLSTGFTKLADPAGWALSYVDKSLTGSGYSSNRSPHTLHNQVYKAIYKKPDDEVDSSSYTLRTFGNLVGLTAGYFALTTLFIPVISGVYSLIRTGQKYFHDLSRGEKEKDNYQKASVIKKFVEIDEKGRKTGEYETESATFYEGFNYSWEKYTNFFSLAKNLESVLTGRGHNNSHFDSKIKKTSKYTRRNGESVFGNLIGGAIGLAASIITLGILPLYKSIKDFKRNFRERT